MLAASDLQGRSVGERSIRILPGQYLDVATGLHQNGARLYDAAIGRYVQSDPIGLTGGSNTYVYASASPLQYVDPLGLDVASFGFQGDWIPGVGVTRAFGLYYSYEGHNPLTSPPVDMGTFKSSGDGVGYDASLTGFFALAPGTDINGRTNNLSVPFVTVSTTDTGSFAGVSFALGPTAPPGAASITTTTTTTSSFVPAIIENAINDATNQWNQGQFGNNLGACHP